MRRWLLRVGGVLIAPRATVAALVGARGAAEGDAGDIALLLVLRAVAGEPERLAAAVASARVIGVAGVAQELLHAASGLLPEVVGIALASLAIGLMAHSERRGRALEVAAYAWVPYLFVTLAGALIFTALGRAPTETQHDVQIAIGLVWSALVGGLGVRALRAPSQGGAVTPEPSKSVPARAGLAGIVLVGGLIALAGVGVMAFARHPERSLPVGVRGEAPDFRLPLLGGGEFHLKEGRQPVLIDFWATWCEPCRAELPSVDKVWRKYKDRVRFVAVDIEPRGAESAVAEFAAQAGLELPLALAGDTTADRWHVESVPHVVLIDGSGHVVKVIQGMRSESGLASAVEDLLRN